MDKQYLDRVNHRKDLIEQYPDIVHGCLPQGGEAVAELYTYLLGDYLPARFPTMFRLSDDRKTFHNLVTDQTYPTLPMEDPLASLRAIGQTVEEDMFLLQGTPDGHLCVAFICCFPSGFDPSKKFGNLLKDIHTPVPSYEKIGASMERVFTKIEVGKSVKRLNVSGSHLIIAHSRSIGIDNVRFSGLCRPIASFSTARGTISLEKTRTPASIAT